MRGIFRELSHNGEEGNITLHEDVIRCFHKQSIKKKIPVKNGNRRPKIMNYFNPKAYIGIARSSLATSRY
jgi:hypothetical protein